MIPEQLPDQTRLAARPNVYELFNRRVVPHGKQLYVLLHESIDASTASPQSVSDLVNAVAAFLGRWAPEAADRVVVDSVLAKEHLSLMDSLVAVWGADMVLDLETAFLRSIAKVFAGRHKLSIFVWDGKPRTINGINAANAYALLDERAMLEGYHVHEELQRWVQDQAATLTQRAELDFGQMAREFAGAGMDVPSPSRFQSLFESFSEEVERVLGHDQMVMIQQKLCLSFRISIQRNGRGQAPEPAAAAASQG